MTASISTQLRSRQLQSSDVLDAYERNGYRLFRNGRMNPFGIRSANRTAGTFDDLIGFLYFKDGEAVVKTYPATTDPGTYYLRKQLLDPDGCAILKPDQWRNAYTIDKHRGKYDALCQRGSKVTVYRDKNRDSVLDMDPAATEHGWFGINIHYDAYSSTNEEDIAYKAGAGCQVFRRRDDFHEFMTFAEESKNQYGNLFDYALFEESDFQSMTQWAEAINHQSKTIHCPHCRQPIDLSSIDRNDMSFGEATENEATIRIKLGPEKHRVLERWQSMEITRLEEAAEEKAESIIDDRDRYEKVAGECGLVPWYLIGIIHTLESNQDFGRHLHNGDPLAERTVRIPEGRPETGKPPFTWEESAIDAIQMKRWHKWKDWRVSDILDRMERYNGSGYRRHHPEVPSPYLWSGSQHYIQGKYIADRKWSGTSVSQQVGGAILLKLIFEKLNVDIV